MANPITISPEYLLVQDDTVKTTSFKVAEAFSKQHHHVVQKIEALDCSASFLTRNFSRVKRTVRGKEYNAYEMTKDGFVFLVMGFTGKQAARIKEAYIDAFNEMARELAGPKTYKNTPTTPNQFSQRFLMVLEKGHVTHMEPLPDNAMMVTPETVDMYLGEMLPDKMLVDYQELLGAGLLANSCVQTLRDLLKDRERNIGK